MEKSYSGKRKSIGIYALCRVAVMAALYLPLARMAIEIGTVKLSLGSLPATVLALAAGPGEAAAAAAIGEFLKQLLSYGFTATTLLWLIPPALRGVLIGFAALTARRNGWYLEDRPVAYFAVSVGSALVVTLVNTLVLWLDSVLYGYYFPGYILGALAARLLVGVVTAVLVGLVTIPMLKILRRQRLLERR